ncbi:MAG TPA: response regulator [Armatimonadota bacterium]|jgi:PAS domain S-box-containing protein
MTPQTQQPDSPLRALLIEDNPGDARLLEEFLRPQTEAAGQPGFSVDRAERLSQGLGLLQASPYAVVLLDLTLPDAQGLDTLRRLKEAAPDQAVVVLTGIDDEALAVQAVHEGAQDYLVKGQVDAPLLSRALRYAIERANSMRTLRESGNRFRSLIEHSYDGLILADAQGVVTYCSPSSQRLLGYAPEELLGHLPLAELVHPEDLRQTQAAFRQLREEPGRVQEQAFRCRHRDGTWRWVETNGQNLLRDAGVESLVIHFRDVTERHEMEEQLRQSQRIEAVGRLAGGLAHDFNNLLTAISGYGELLQQRLPKEDPGHRFAEEISQACSRASSLVRQLLAFSRRQVLQPEGLDLSALLQNLRTSLERLLPPGTPVSIEADRRCGPILADPASLEQAILNLALHARDALPEGEGLTISVGDAEEGDAFVRGLPSVGDSVWAVLTVGHTGGADGERTTPVVAGAAQGRGRGSGLGLSTAHEIVKQAGGDILVAISPGRAAEFRVYLPHARATEALPGPVRPQGETQTILLVEDEKAVSTLIRDLLTMNGYHVVEATGVADALRTASTCDGGVQMLLSDLSVHGDTGPALAQRLREEHPGLKVLLMHDASAEALPVKQQMERFPLLRKPFSPDELALRVREVLAAEEES